MLITKKYFGAGLILGILIAYGFFHFFAPRYTTRQFGRSLIKQDRWTGKTWRYENNEWKTILTVNQKWEYIDQVLRDALYMDYSHNNSISEGLHMLRGKYPVLTDFTDNELLERIKTVYSKEVLNKLYLKQFLHLHEKGLSEPNELESGNKLPASHAP